MQLTSSPIFVLLLACPITAFIVPPTSTFANPTQLSATAGDNWIKPKWANSVFLTDAASPAKVELKAQTKTAAAKPSKGKDEQEFTAYVCNLSYGTTNKQLRDLFNEHGSVKKVFMPMNQSDQKPKGIAFVGVSSQDELTKAIEAISNSELDGRTIYVREATPRGLKPQGAKSSGGGNDERRAPSKIHVGNLSYDTTKEDLMEYFGEFGTVEDVFVPKNLETGYSRGFAFITLPEDACVAAIEKADGVEFQGRPLTVAKSLPRGNKTMRAENQEGVTSVKLYVGNLSFDTEEETVRSVFGEYGEIYDLYLPTDRYTERPRGFAFVTMSGDGATTAIEELNGYDLDGRILRVNEAQERGYVPQYNDEESEGYDGGEDEWAQ